MANHFVILICDVDENGRAGGEYSRVYADRAELENLLEDDLTYPLSNTAEELAEQVRYTLDEEDY